MLYINPNPEEQIQPFTVKTLIEVLITLDENLTVHLDDGQPIMYVSLESEIYNDKEIVQFS